MFVSYPIPYTLLLTDENIPVSICMDNQVSLWVVIASNVVKEAAVLSIIRDEEEQHGSSTDDDDEIEFRIYGK